MWPGRNGVNVVLLLGLQALPFPFPFPTDTGVPTLFTSPTPNPLHPSRDYLGVPEVQSQSRENSFRPDLGGVTAELVSRLGREPSGSPRKQHLVWGHSEPTKQARGLPPTSQITKYNIRPEPRGGVSPSRPQAVANEGQYVQADAGSPPAII